MNHWGVTVDIYFWTGLHQLESVLWRIDLFFCLLQLRSCRLLGCEQCFSFWPLELLLIYMNRVKWVDFSVDWSCILSFCVYFILLSHHLIWITANHHPICCDDCSLSALTSFWSLLKGKGTMGQVAVVEDVAAEQEDLAIEMESATCQRLPLKILDNSLPWVAIEILQNRFPSIFGFLNDRNNLVSCFKRSI